MSFAAFSLHIKFKYDFQNSPPSGNSNEYVMSMGYVSTSCSFDFCFCLNIRVFCAKLCQTITTIKNPKASKTLYTSELFKIFYASCLDAPLSMCTCNMYFKYFCYMGRCSDAPLTDVATLLHNSIQCKNLCLCCKAIS